MRSVELDGYARSLWAPCASNLGTVEVAGEFAAVEAIGVLVLPGGPASIARLLATPAVFHTALRILDVKPELKVGMNIRRAPPSCTITR